ncbi:MAG: sulfatase [bacterium]
MTAQLTQLARFAIGPLVAVITLALLLTLGQLPDLSPPSPPRISEKQLASEHRRRTIDTGRLGRGDAEVPAIRLLDHLQTALRTHPDLVRSYRALARAKGAPGHWRHYIDPWSKLPASLRPLLVQMNFASRDVRRYASSGRLQKSGGPAHQFGRDRRMNSTPGVNEMRLSLFAPPPASFTFQVAVEEGAALTFGTGVPANGPQGPVTFSVEVATNTDPPQVVASFAVGTAQRNEWQNRRVDLSKWKNQAVRLTLRTRGPKGAFAFWSNPILWKPRSARPGKNIVFILIDTLRADAVYSVAGKYPVTPHMDAMAARGVTFTQCYAMSSWTRSSMLGMFTSEHVTRFDPVLNTNFWLPNRFRQQMYARWPRLLTRHIKKSGYWVEAIGNNFFLPGYTPIGFDRGFDHVTDIRAHVIDTPAVTRGAIRFLRSHKEKPFFLYLHYDGPHQPYWVPKGYAVRGARPPGGPHDLLFEHYIGEARWTDDHLAPVFAELKRSGLDSNTIVVLTGDHGEVFHKAHDFILAKKQRTLHHHGWSAYQEVVHVPLIITGPGLPAGRRIADPVSHIDLAPTLLDLAGLPAMSGSHGRSWSTPLKNNTPVPARPIASVSRWSYGYRKGRWKLIHRLGGARSVRRPRAPERQLYIVDELYDLEVDPHETRNLARLHPVLTRKLREELLSTVHGGQKDAAVSGGSVFTRQGLRLSLRLAGGSGPHQLEGSLECDGTVVVRNLRGPTSHTAYRGRGRVAVLLKNQDTLSSEVELEFVGCVASTIKLNLRLDGKPLTPRQVVVGPYGLRMMKDASRLPLADLPALISRRPPPLLPSPAARLHLWLGSSYSGGLDLDGGKDRAARLADEMLRDAGYAKGSSRPKSPMR